LLVAVETTRKRLATNSFLERMRAKLTHDIITQVGLKI